MKAIKVSYKAEYMTRSVEVVDAPIKDNLDFFYKNIGCDMIDCVYFDGFDVWVDDEGLLKSDNLVFEYTHKGFSVPLAGNLVITKGVDSQGATLFFEDDEDLSEIFEMLNTMEFKGTTK